VLALIALSIRLIPNNVLNDARERLKNNPQLYKKKLVICRDYCSDLDCDSVLYIRSCAPFLEMVLCRPATAGVD